MRKTLLTGTLTVVACAGLIAAQAQNPTSQTPSPSPTTQTPGTTSSASSQRSASANTITVEGCIQRGTGSSTAGATGTAGSSGDAFILANAMKSTGTSGSSSGSSSSSSASGMASSYRLDADASKLSPHVGHKVEITGTLESSMSSSSSSSPSSGAAGGATSSASSTASAPRLKVDNVKMVSTTCTP